MFLPLEKNPVDAPVHTWCPLTGHSDDFSDKRVANQIQQKIASAEQYLQQLQTSERSMTQHQKARSDQKKLTVF